MRARGKRRAAKRLATYRKGQLSAEEREKLINKAKPSWVTPVGTALGGAALGQLAGYALTGGKSRKALAYGYLAGGALGAALGLKQQKQRRKALAELLRRQGYSEAEIAKHL